MAYLVENKDLLECEVGIHAKGGLRRELRRRIRREALRVGLLGVEFVATSHRKNQRREMGERIGDPIPMVRFKATKEQLEAFSSCLKKFSEDGWLSTSFHPGVTDKKTEKKKTDAESIDDVVELPMRDL